jgi:heme-degrading monooxygenase HmoA
MYIRLQLARVDPSKVDEVAAIMREVLPTMKQRPGFQNAYIGAHRESGRGFVMTMWDTEEHASYTLGPEAAATGARLQALGVQGEPPVVYEVTDQI